MAVRSAVYRGVTGVCQRGDRAAVAFLSPWCFWPSCPPHRPAGHALPGGARVFSCRDGGDKHRLCIKGRPPHPSGFATRPLPQGRGEAGCLRVLTSP
ncbi:hypothetical protein KKY_1898 [Pelagibacterium halotolerans B2]|uniref:Uncharacterized protein n=1 Tax=Pelagibacterium halotolerans (strain DSM 22347 / JCM 15775 / CGMCC 1.7692 / B2) TaxID=1082931 RepID=G4RET8_PELHB|nr:hypothetical protein KKY_1898 [Pelagibacterium halotolerans B2]